MKIHSNKTAPRILTLTDSERGDTATWMRDVNVGNISNFIHSEHEVADGMWMKKSVY